MNYARIYSAFIADRQTKQPEKPAYFERHHIVPKCIGGTNEPDNMIRLTPEDHFFAHLLLAKIHGGELWSPVAFMVGGSRKDYVPTQSRKRHGWAARALSKSKTGDGAYQFDRKIYELVHFDGRTWAGLQSQMHKVLGMTRPLANLLVKKKIKSAQGWSLKELGTFEQKGKNHPMYKHETYDFVHVDGRNFYGTQHDFHLFSGLVRSSISRLTKGHVKTWRGWRLKGTELPTIGRAAKWQKYLNGQSAT